MYYDILSSQCFDNWISVNRFLYSSLLVFCLLIHSSEKGSSECKGTRSTECSVGYKEVAAGVFSIVKAN